jgi:hypothetical protein
MSLFIIVPFFFSFYGHKQGNMAHKISFFFLSHWHLAHSLFLLVYIKLYLVRELQV